MRIVLIVIKLHHANVVPCNFLRFFNKKVGMKIDFKNRARPFLGTAKLLILNDFPRNDFKSRSHPRQCTCDGSQGVQVCGLSRPFKIDLKSWHEF